MRNRGGGASTRQGRGRYNKAIYAHSKRRRGVMRPDGDMTESEAPANQTCQFSARRESCVAASRANMRRKSPACPKPAPAPPVSSACHLSIPEPGCLPTFPYSPTALRATAEAFPRGLASPRPRPRGCRRRRRPPRPTPDTATPAPCPPTRPRNRPAKPPRPRPEVPHGENLP